MDKRFKPIGGMFQGVRGSTTKGGSAKYAGKLLKLDADGKVDDSVLSDSVRQASSVAEDLEEEKRVRAAADTALSERQESYETASAARLSELATLLAAVQDAIDVLAGKEDGDIAGVNADIGAIQHRTTALENASTTQAGQISTLQAASTALDNALTALRSRVAALELSVNGDASHSGLIQAVAELNAVYNTLNAAVTTLNGQMTEWVNAMTTLRAELTGVETDLSSYKESTDIRLQGIDSSMASLSAKVDEIYDRLVNSQNG